MIYTLRSGDIEEPDWKELADQFDELSFEIYTSRGLVEVDSEVEG